MIVIICSTFHTSIDQESFKADVLFIIVTLHVCHRQRFYSNLNWRQVHQRQTWARLFRILVNSRPKVRRNTEVQIVREQSKQTGLYTPATNVVQALGTDLTLTEWAFCV